MTTHISKVARDFNLTETRDNKTFFLATTTTAKLSFARKILREPTLVDKRPKTVHCLLDDLFMATPAWPTPMRALISKLNLSYAPGRPTDSALFNRSARRAVARIPTSSIHVSTPIS